MLYITLEIACILYITCTMLTMPTKSLRLQYS